ncbi:Hypothetical protein POVN_LOCUS231 [uncultured virus]|nr:Hypothetical protein POVN_LOCUS231 [uncultured virus]
MSDFAKFMGALLGQKQAGPGAAYTWVVEAFFLDKEDPAKGMYTQLGVHETRAAAEEQALELTKQFTHDFLTFRARPMRFFREFGDINNTLFITDDEKFNAALIKHEKEREELKVKHDREREVQEMQFKDETKAGTDAHFVRLLYLCSKHEAQMLHHIKEAKQAQQVYNERSAELKRTCITHPKLLETWTTHAKLLFQLSGQPQGLDYLEGWWKTNKDKYVAEKLPLPEERDVVMRDEMTGIIAAPTDLAPTTS